MSGWCRTCDIWIGRYGLVGLSESEGTRLQAVDIIPAALPWKLTELQKRFVYWAIKFIGAEADCYRYGPPGPDLDWLDYGALRALRVPKLEAIAHYVASNEPDLKVSRQTLANALAVCGMRLPSRRPRVNQTIFAPQLP
ncbi:hypothetical protein [Methyloceanibacter sp.]|uniref:hypothetical protein n=1 Tax=Methyloceanibacter sp. TaxID=1965321 RepID=UPI002D76E6E3|nr:hypothetical protein [Methyloceanibacter sp.]